MEFIILGVVSVIAILVLMYIFNYNMKELKHIGEDKELDNLAKS